MGRVETGREVARRRGVDVNWRVEDATRWQPDPGAFDLVLVGGAAHAIDCLVRADRPAAG